MCRMRGSDYLCEQVLTLPRRCNILRFPHGAVVKSVITPACHAGGRGFESRPPRQSAFQNLWRRFVFLGVAAGASSPSRRDVCRVGVRAYSPVSAS